MGGDPGWGFFSVKSPHARIQEFCQGGGGGGGPDQSDKKKQKKNTDGFLLLFCCIFRSPQLIFYKSQMVNFIKNLSFFKVPEEVQHFPGGGVQLFLGGGGSNCLFPIETHITCDFAGVRTPAPPPLDPHLLLVFPPSSRHFHSLASYYT